LLYIEKPEDIAILEYIANDPLIYKGKLRVATGLTIIDSIQYSNDNINRVKTPVYLLQGRQDNICKPEGASKYFDNLTIQDKTLIMLDGNFIKYFFNI
jgi:acylglycerol lipase